MFVLWTFSFLLLAVPGGAQIASPPAVKPQDLEKRISELINAERVKVKLKPLKIDPRLSEIARRHSGDMSRRRFFDHVNPDGQGPTERGLAAQYKCVKHLAPYVSQDASGNVFQGEYVARGLAENIFQNNLYSRVIMSGTNKTYEWNTAEKIVRTTVDGWMASPGHRENILTGRYEKTGVGVAIAANAQILITQMFC
jgi:uncharacterized protein YkwD